VVVELGSAIDPVTNAMVHALDRALAEAHFPGVREVVPAYASLLVHVDPVAIDPRDLIDGLRRLAEAVARHDDRAGPPAGTHESLGRTLEIPVWYGGDAGPDLGDVARQAGLSADEVIRRHRSAEYVVAMLGFAPGFPYLMGLDPTIACPRLETPRVRVPAGSVAIAERQAGIYPYAMPGGWRLIGRTAMTLFDPGADPPAALAPGDRVRFVAADDRFDPGVPSSAGAALRAERTGSRDAAGATALRVVEAGIQATVQDRGRFGYQRYGLPPSGAADLAALSSANASVGNGTDGAAIEITAGSFEVEFLEPVTFALSGAAGQARVGGREVRFASAVAARGGEHLRLGLPSRGFRTYLAVAGGIDVPVVLGSRSTYLPAGFGGFDGRALRTGDELPVATKATAPMAPPQRGEDRVPPQASWAEALRAIPFVPSGQWETLPVEARRSFLTQQWTVSHRSDRMGLRLEGQPLAGAALGRGFVSDGTVTGAIQLSGDGLPIVLGVDRQTTGGYPKLGAVTSGQLHVLGQLQPGDVVMFRAVSLEDAIAEARTRR
jgi:KipI family sensor histidine kinase inhibitor